MKTAHPVQSGIASAFALAALLTVSLGAQSDSPVLDLSGVKLQVTATETIREIAYRELNGDLKTMSPRPQYKFVKVTMAAPAPAGDWAIVLRQDSFLAVVDGSRPKERLAIPSIALQDGRMMGATWMVMRPGNLTYSVQLFVHSEPILLSAAFEVPEGTTSFIVQYPASLGNVKVAEAR